MDICLDVVPAAPLPPMQKRDAQHMFLQHGGAHAELSWMGSFQHVVDLLDQRVYVDLRGNILDHNLVKHQILIPNPWTSLVRISVSNQVSTGNSYKREPRRGTNCSTASSRTFTHLLRENRFL